MFARYFGPILDALRALGGSGSPSEVIQRIVQDLRIPDKVQNELLDSGQSRFVNQVHWGRFYLTRAGLLESSKRGVWRLSELGRRTHLTEDEAQQLVTKWAGSNPLSRRARDEDTDQTLAPADENSDLIFGRADETQRSGLGNYRSQLLALLLELPPAGFERLSKRLLREAGFSQVEVTGRSGDGGIDGHGVLQLNQFVSFKVLFQCKRYAQAVSSPDVRNFRGAMQGRADKAIIITTGTFTADASREASRDGAPPIELIDGEKLIGMLEEFELGLRKVTTFQVDDDFFKEFRA